MFLVKLATCASFDVNYEEITFERGLIDRSRYLIRFFFTLRAVSSKYRFPLVQGGSRSMINRLKELVSLAFVIWKPLLALGRDCFCRSPMLVRVLCN